MHRARWVILCLLAAGAFWFGHRPGKQPAPPVAPAQSAPAPSEDVALAQFRAWAQQRTVAEPIAPLVHESNPPAAILVSRSVPPANSLPLSAGSNVIPARDDIESGLRLARLRRDALKRLIGRDPQRAINESISQPERAALGAPFAPHLEERIEGMGSFAIIAQIGDPDRPPISRAVRLNGRSFHASIAGPLPRRSLAAAKISGIALDGCAAVRVEPINPRGAAAANAIAAPAVPANNGPQPLAAAQPLASSIPGGTIGIHRVLIIRARFSDQSSDPATVDELTAVMNGVNAFYVENSFGKTSLVSTITTQPIILPHSAQWYRDNDTSGYALNVLEDARAAAKSAGYNWDTEYDLEAVRYNDGPGEFTGQANLGQRGCWLKVTSLGVTAHELGHNFGNSHANAWEPNPPGNPIGPGANSEYGDVFDTMGNAAAGALHFNAYEKVDLGWMSAQTVTASGRYRLYAHDQGAAGAGTMALKLRKDSRYYWLEFRQNPGWSSQPFIWNGVGLRWGAWGGSNGGTQLLDVTPGSPFGKDDSPIAIGSTFSDPLVPVYITPVAKNGTSPVESVDVVVNFGDFAGNCPPTLSLSASALEVPINTPVTLTATAADPDGDTLSYAWSLGDRSAGANSATIVKSWPSPGRFRVRCTVSDMKGKTASQSLIIKAGAPSGYLVSGRVTDMAGQPLADVCVFNGLGPGSANYRSAMTDSDGTYTLTDVRAGVYTISAQKAGYDFAADGFANPITVGPDSANVNLKGWQRTWTISGKVTDAGLSVGGVVVTNGTRTEVTNSSGLYTFYGITDGRYTLSAQKPGYAFTTSGWTQPILVDGANVTGRDFLNYLLPRYRVSGIVTGVADGTAVKVSTANGAYTVNVTTPNPYSLYVPPGQWNLIATAAGSSFSPAGWTNPVEVLSDVSGKDFTKDPDRRWSITGRVTDLNAPLAGVVVTAGAASSTTDAAGVYRIAGLADGTYTLAASKAGYTFAPASQDAAVAGADVTGKDFASTSTVDPPPWIVAAAAASPNPVSGTTTMLSVVADDDKGASLLGYSWALVGPAPGPVSFSVNNAHSAQSTTATFSRAGAYVFRVTVTDEHGGVATSDVAVQVNQTPTAFAVTPAASTILAGSSLQFTARLVDQFVQDMPLQPAMSWAASGGGAIDSAGLFASDGTLGLFTITATAGTMSGSAGLRIAAPPGPGTGIARQWYLNIPGANLSDLTSAPAYPHLPSGAQILAPACEAPAEFGDNYGQRLRGWFICPGTGAYTFYIASDDASALYLGTDSIPASKVKIAEVPGFTSPRQWDRYASQQSEPIPLIGGNRYYIEALHKEANGGDHLEIGVDTPGGVPERPIPAHRIVPLPIVTAAASTPIAREWGDNPGAFTLSRTGPTDAELSVSYTVGGSAAPGSDYQALSGTATFPAGAATVRIAVQPIDDLIAEPDETVILRVLDGADYAVSADGAATVTIADDEIAATVTATDPEAREPIYGSAAPPASEDSCDGDFVDPLAGPAGPAIDTGTFTVTLARASAADVTIRYAVGGTATPGADYETLAGTVTISAGQTSATITVVPLADQLAEVPETVIVTLSPGEGYTIAAPTSATVVIGDALPAVPALTVAALDGRTIELKWTDVFSNEEGYNVERLQGGVWTTVASLGAGVSTWKDASLSPAMLLTYRVRARLGGQFSGYSNEASATTWKLGDVNGDGRIDLMDIQIIERNFGQSGATWQQGDVTGDGVVSRADYTAVFRNLGK